MSQAIRGSSQVYHPYDLATKTTHTADNLASAIADSFDKINGIAEQVDLSAKCRKYINKTTRVVDLMLETMAWTHQEIQIRLSVVGLTMSERSAASRFTLFWCSCAGWSQRRRKRRTSATRFSW